MTATNKQGRKRTLKTDWSPGASGEKSPRESCAGLRHVARRAEFESTSPWFVVFPPNHVLPSTNPLLTIVQLCH